MKWAYGVTTVPSRRGHLLYETLSSLRIGGFPSPHLFVDGDCDGLSWSREFGLPVTMRGLSPVAEVGNVRVAGNWLLSIYELLYRYPQADRYAIFQDDLIIYRNLRDYLEFCPYPKDGYLNLYSWPSNESIAPRVNASNQRQVGWYRSNQLGKGAVALVFSPEALEKLLSSPHMAGRPRHPTDGHRKIDGGIIDSMKKEGWYEYVHNPSLVQHTGDVSSMGNTSHPKSTTFRGKDYDAKKLMEEAATHLALVNSERESRGAARQLNRRGTFGRGRDRGTGEQVVG